MSRWSLAFFIFGMFVLLKKSLQVLEQSLTGHRAAHASLAGPSMPVGGGIQKQMSMNQPVYMPANQNQGYMQANQNQYTAYQNAQAASHNPLAGAPYQSQSNAAFQQPPGTRLLSSVDLMLHELWWPRWSDDCFDAVTFNPNATCMHFVLRSCSDRTGLITSIIHFHKYLCATLKLNMQTSVFKDGTMIIVSTICWVFKFCLLVIRI